MKAEGVLTTDLRAEMGRHVIRQRELAEALGITCSQVSTVLAHALVIHPRWMEALEGIVARKREAVASS